MTAWKPNEALARVDVIDDVRDAIHEATARDK
jgi:hypothetical protein